LLKNTREEEVCANEHGRTGDTDLSNVRRYLIAGLLLLSVLLGFSEAGAQMRIQYPNQFRFSGLIELTYSSFNFADVNDDDKSRGADTYRQNYGLNLEGYIYHPRLIVFTTGINYSYSIRKPDYYDDKDSTFSDIGYNARVTFLPYRPVSLQVYAQKTDYTVDSWRYPENTRTSKIYGAKLTMRLKRLPLITFEYRHEDYELLLYTKAGNTKVKTDLYMLHFRDHIPSLNTTYAGLLQSYDYSSSRSSYSNKYLRFYANTVFKKFYLSNYFNYSKSDNYKLLSYSTYLYFPIQQRFGHNYGYEYFKSETEFRGIPKQNIQGNTQESTIHTIRGSWSYRITERLRYSLSLQYGKDKQNNEDSKFQGISSMISYGRPLFFGVDFMSRYRYTHRKHDLRGELKEHGIELDLITRRFRYGTIYMNYAFIKTQQEDRFFQRESDDFGVSDSQLDEAKVETDAKIHSLRLGIRGRAPTRRLSKAQWGIEGEWFKSTVKGTRPATTFDDFFGDFLTGRNEKFERVTKRYSVIGDVSYPFHGGLTVLFRTGYTVGENDSLKFTKFFYEENIFYPIIRNLILQVRYKETWEDVKDSYDQRLREYGLVAQYRRGKLFLELEGRILRSKSDDVELEIRRFYLRLKRVI
jgi:hypothetical protein